MLNHLNEEEVKLKIILPYLRRLGLQDNELNCESSFTLQIGTSKVTVNGSGRSKNSVGGRLDILIKRCNTNLLILELKESDHKLKKEDRDQAISYARLVHPIAPYAVVTNGRHWQIFDVITKEELKAGDVKIKDGYHLVLPDYDREEALNFFLGYSEENLLQFCNSQVREQLKPLIGSPQDLTKKYIPELTTPRKNLIDELSKFEGSDTAGFLLVAESGQGKTSALCDLALTRLKEKKPTLFFWGAVLEASLLPAITNEFGWVFSEEFTPITLIRRLSGLCKNSPIVVVIDAIDEWTYSQKAQSLVNLLRNCSSYRVKFVFSCRAAVWDSISKPLGSDIGFEFCLFKTSSGDQSSEVHQLETFSDQEFFNTIDKYEEVFSFRGAFEDKVFEEARLNPFMLRIMFVVASELQQGHLTFSSKKFFEKYLEIILRKTGKPHIANAQIQGIAKLMFNKNEEVVSDEDVRKALPLSVNEEILPALFEQNILQHQADGYGFYFQHLRSYVIAFKICKWPSATPDRAAKVSRSGVQLEALAFYLRYATSEHIREITKPIWDNAKEYLELYSIFVSRHFPELEYEFVPGKKGELGFIAEYVVHRNILGGYGFRRCSPTDERVLLIPVDEFFSHSNLPYLNGANALYNYGSSHGFNMMNVREEVVEHELIDRIRDAIKERRLSLKGSEKLASEALISAIWNDQRTFAAFWNSYSKSVQFPISVKNARETIQRAKLRTHFESEMTQRKRKKGTLEEKWSNRGIVSYNRNFTKDEETEINTNIEKSIQTGSMPNFRAVVVSLRKLERALN